MEIVFMGTSDFAVPSLNILANSAHRIIGVVSQPDRPKGRGKRLQPTPVKEVAQKLGIPVFQPNSIKAVEAVDKIKKWNPDLIVVVAYGQIIPLPILNFPPGECINVHASLLPKYRGAAPIQRALMAGETITGVTTMFLDEGLDTGDIIMQKPQKIDEEITHGELEKILAQKGAELLIDTITELEKGDILRVKQDGQEATYAQMLTREEEIIDWSDSAVSIHNKIRAMSPSPGAYFYADGLRIKTYKSRVHSKSESGLVSEVIDSSAGALIIQTGQGQIELLEVQKEGKKRMSSGDFLKGFQLKPGTLLEDRGS